MGYSIPAALGAAMAQKDLGIDAPVIAVCGDGSFQMSMMELATIKAQKLPVKMVLFVNDRLGMVRELQDRFYAQHEIAVDLDGSPNFSQLVQSYGIQTGVINQSEPDIDGVIAAFLASKEAYLLEVIVSPNESTL